MPDLSTIPAPADAQRTDVWEEWDANDWRRYFTISEQHRPGAHRYEWFSVSLRGEQDQTGRVARWAYVDALGECTSAQLRKFAASLLDAADRLDALGA